MENLSQEQEPVVQEEVKSIFDTPIPVEDSEDGEYIRVKDEFESSFSNNDDQGGEDYANGQRDNGNDNDEDPINPNIQPGEEQEDIDFDDELTKLHKQREEEEQKEFDENDAIERLKAMGYNVDKEVSPESQEKLELDRLNGLINRGNEFLSLPDEEVVKRKIRTDLSQKYLDQGKQHLIGSTEFEEEIEDEFLEYEGNSRMLQVFASSIRRDVKDAIKEHEDERNQISGKINQREQQQVAENRLKLQDSIKSMVKDKNGFLGIKLSIEDSKEIYQSVTSGSFAKQVNSDPNLVAEFAAFIRFRDQIKDRIGGPSYGEGVKAAVDAITGNKVATKSPLGTMMASTSSKSEKGGRKSWAMPTVSSEELDKSVVVAGKPQLY